MTLFHVQILIDGLISKGDKTDFWDVQKGARGKKGVPPFPLPQLPGLRPCTFSKGCHVARLRRCNGLEGAAEFTLC